MPLPGIARIDYYFGDTLDDVRFAWEDAAGNPKSLVGFTAKMQIRDGFGAPALLTLADPTVSGLTIIADSGFVDITAPFVLMTGGLLEAGQLYNFDCQVTDGTDIYTLGAGDFVTHQEVTV